MCNMAYSESVHRHMASMYLSGRRCWMPGARRCGLCQRHLPASVTNYSIYYGIKCCVLLTVGSQRRGLSDWPVHTFWHLMSCTWSQCWKKNAREEALVIVHFMHLMFCTQQCLKKKAEKSYCAAMPPSVWLDWLPRLSFDPGKVVKSIGRWQFSSKIATCLVYNLVYNIVYSNVYCPWVPNIY